MKKQFTGSVEYKGVEYDYTAVIYTGDDAHTYPDQITDLERTDGEPIDEDIREEVEDAVLDHANRISNPSFAVKTNEALFYNTIADRPGGWVINVDENRVHAFCHLIEACGNVIHGIQHIGFSKTADIQYGRRPINEDDVPKMSGELRCSRKRHP